MKRVNGILSEKELHKRKMIAEIRKYDILIPIKQPWFDMIKSGIKREEYRKDGHYWRIRIKNAAQVRYPIVACFRNGYSLSSPTYTCVITVSRGIGKKEWGATDEKCLILHLYDFSISGWEQARLDSPFGLTI